jgi:hypothetical protein
MADSLLTTPLTSASVSTAVGRSASTTGAEGPQIDLIGPCFALRLGTRDGLPLTQCGTCTPPADGEEKPVREEYLDGCVVICGYRDVNVRMKEWLSRMAATPTGRKLVRALQAAGGAPIALIYHDPACAELAFPGNAWVAKAVAEVGFGWFQYESSAEAAHRAVAVGYNDGHDGEQSAFAGQGLSLWLQKKMFGAPPDSRWIVRGVGASRGECFVRWELADHSDDRAVPSIGHELIHCLHAIRGECLSQYSDAGRSLGPDGKSCTVYNTYEEARTIGIVADHYEAEELSENRIRHELGLPTYASHCGGLDPSWPDTTATDAPLRARRSEEINYPDLSAFGK